MLILGNLPTKLMTIATSLERWQNKHKMTIYICTSTNFDNLEKIGPVLPEIVTCKTQAEHIVTWLAWHGSVV